VATPSQSSSDNSLSILISPSTVVSNPSRVEWQPLLNIHLPTPSQFSILHTAQLLYNNCSIKWHFTDKLSFKVSSSVDWQTFLNLHLSKQCVEWQPLHNKWQPLLNLHLSVEWQPLVNLHLSKQCGDSLCIFICGNPFSIFVSPSSVVWQPLQDNHIFQWCGNPSQSSSLQAEWIGNPFLIFIFQPLLDFNLSTQCGNPFSIIIIGLNEGAMAFYR